MQTIHKYKLGHGRNALKIPAKAKVLSAANQREELVVWFLFDEKEYGKEFIWIHVVMTGEAIDDVLKDETKVRFVNTVLFDNGAYVVHVFEHLKREPQ